jgi:hypothetical protein
VALFDSTKREMIIFKGNKEGLQNRSLDVLMRSKLNSDFLEFLRERCFGMLVLEVLLVGFWIRHLCLLLIRKVL